MAGGRGNMRGRCKKRIKKSAAFATDLFGRGRRTLSPRSTLVGQDGSTVPKGTVFTAVLFSSFCKKRIKKIGCFCNRPFWQGQKDSFSSLDARRSGRLYRAKGHGIHCRPILVLLQEANKKIGCLCNRPFWQTHTFGIRTFYRNGRMVIFL